MGNCHTPVAWELPWTKDRTWRWHRRRWRRARGRAVRAGHVDTQQHVAAVAVLANWVAILLWLGVWWGQGAQVNCWLAAMKHSSHRVLEHAYTAWGTVPVPAPRALLGLPGEPWTEAQSFGRRCTVASNAPSNARVGPTWPDACKVLQVQQQEGAYRTARACIAMATLDSRPTAALEVAGPRLVELQGHIALAGGLCVVTTIQVAVGCGDVGE